VIYNLGCVLESMGRKDESDQAVRADLRGGYWLPGRGGQGGCVLRRRASVAGRRVKSRRQLAIAAQEEFGPGWRKRNESAAETELRVSRLVVEWGD